MIYDPQPYLYIPDQDNDEFALPPDQYLTKPGYCSAVVSQIAEMLVNNQPVRSCAGTEHPLLPSV